MWLCIETQTTRRGKKRVTEKRGEGSGSDGDWNPGESGVTDRPLDGRGGGKGPFTFFFAEENKRPPSRPVTQRSQGK